MIYFLFGEDTYRAKEKLKEIVERYKNIHQSGLNLKFFDFSEEDKKFSFSDFLDNSRQTSMFKEKKLLIIKNAFNSSDFRNNFLKNKENLKKSGDIFIFFEEKPDKKTELFKFLEKNAKFQEFKFLTGQKLRNWVKKEFEKNGANCGSVEIEKIISRVGNDLWLLNNEIKKLVCYKKGGNIEIKDILLLTRPIIETDIFKTIDALAQKNKKEALKLLHKHIEKGDSPLYLLTMINYQFRNLLIIKDLLKRQYSFQLIAKKSGLHPFVVRKTYYQSYYFTFSELKKIYQKIFQADFDIKTGKKEPEIALDLLISEI